ncbi:hypothetical protein TtJL18_2408 (plasmid) [Thermus thermophilus JL-18]|uniref:Uncharacterized protein n=1 Tax=Thermus thermophilus JL-18 TaxID=798128 RepID=H9ZV73_THETH|nr:hypothetical protein TtJL18_2408 [Thermus thermophilus JL-18]
MWWRYALGLGVGLLLAYTYGPEWFFVGLGWAFWLDLVDALGVRREKV